MSNQKKYSRKRGKFKNSFEVKVYKELEKSLGPVLYEPFTFHYKVDEVRKYTPDFFIKGSSGLYIEGKGKFTGADRKKMLLVKEQHPEVEFRFYFVSAEKKLSKNSKTTYGQWCEKHGFSYTDLKKGVKKWTDGRTGRGITKSSDMTSQKSRLKSSGSTRLSETPGN